MFAGPVQDMSEGDKYTCPLCVRALQQQERREQRKAEAAAAAEIEREAKEAQAARKAKLVRHKQNARNGNLCSSLLQTLAYPTEIAEASLVSMAQQG